MLRCPTNFSTARSGPPRQWNGVNH